MANSKIGIILADGEFYPIMDDDRSAQKRLVVSTVRDKQKSVQINVYRRDDQGTDKSYVGSLFVENIPLMPSGEPDIRLDLGLDEEGNLHAEAREEKSGKSQALNVSLRSLSADEISQGAEFSLDTEELESEPMNFDLPEAEESLASESSSSEDLEFEIPDMGHELPEADDFPVTEVEDSSVPETDGFSVPEVDDFSVPEAEDFSVPEVDDFSVPEVDDFSVPEVDDFSVPEVDDFSVSAEEPTLTDESTSEQGSMDFNLPDLDDTLASEDSSDDFPEVTIPDAGSPEEDAAFASYAGTSAFDANEPEAEDMEEPTGSLLDKSQDAKKGGLKPLLIALIAVLGTAAILACAFLVYKCTAKEPTGTVPTAQTTEPVKPPIKTEPVPEPVKTEPVVPVAAETPKVEPAAVVVAPEPVKTQVVEPVQETPKPSATEAVPKAAAAKKPGVWYKVKWGDTLWDLAYVYYRNPWLYPKIATANKLKDADRIISGKWIFIPPK